MSLQTLNQSYKDFTQRQADGKVIPKTVEAEIVKRSTVHAGGFPVVNEDHRSALRNRHIESMKQYAHDRAVLVTDLKKAGIKVLASLPVAEWKKICDQSKLIDFKSDSSGEVNFSVGTAVGLFQDIGIIASIAVSVMLFIAAGGASFFGINSYYHDISWTAGMGWSLIGCCIASFFALVTASSVTYRWMMGAVTALFGHRYSFLSKVIGDRQETGERNTKIVKVILPTPPKDVQAVLVQLSRHTEFNVRTAAVPQALAFNPPLSSLMRDGIKAQQEEAARIRALQRDPIVYVLRDGVVAIVAQFGDFPIEQKVVDHLTKNEVIELPY